MPANYATRESMEERAYQNARCICGCRAKDVRVEHRVLYPDEIHAVIIDFYCGTRTRVHAHASPRTF